MDDLAGSRRLVILVAVSEQSIVFITMARDNPAVSVEAKNQRRALEGAEHQGEAAIGDEMRSGFVSAAGEIEIDDGVGIEHAERCHISRREIDATFAGGRGIEKDVLPLDELAMFRRNGAEVFPHADSLAGRQASPGGRFR